METWKQCVGWENFYEVSSDGNVRSVKRKVKTSLGIAMKGGNQLKKIIVKNGYEVVNLSANNKKNQVLVHKLVLTAFAGERPKNYQACHGNGIKHDNRILNLRWDTVKNNHADKKIHNTNLQGEKNPIAKLTEEQAKIVKYSKLPLEQLAKEFNVSFGCVNKIRYNQTWKHV